MRIRSCLLALSLGSSVALSQNTEGGEDRRNKEELQKLLRRIEELERKVKELEQRNAVPPAKNPAETPNELGQESTPSKKQPEPEKPASQEPRISIGEKGFALASADDRFSVEFKALLQADSRTFFHDSGIVGNDALLLRRLRPMLQGVLFSNIDFLFVPDFGGNGAQIFDAYVNYKLCPELQLQAGKTKAPVGLEQLQTDAFTLLNERSLVTAMVPNRDIGFELHGDFWQGAVSYVAGIFNGVGDARLSNNTDFEDNKEFGGRIFFQPFAGSSVWFLKGAGIGLGGNYTAYQKTNIAGLPNTTGGVLPGYSTDGQQQFFAYNPTNGVVTAQGEHWHLSPQGYYYAGPFGLFGEYVLARQGVENVSAAPKAESLTHSAWEITGLWNLTGETAAYNAPLVPSHPFSIHEGGWGAWQLVIRYAELTLDDHTFPTFSNDRASAHRAASTSVGINWWLNRNLRLAASFSHTDFRGGGGPVNSVPAVVTRRDENVLFTRVQLSF